MSKRATGKWRTAFPAIIFLVLFMGPAVPCESGNMSPDSSQPQTGKTVRLQIRISEAKKKKHALHYYRSVARQQKAGRISLPVHPLQAHR